MKFSCKNQIIFEFYNVVTILFMVIKTKQYDSYNRLDRKELQQVQ